VRGELVIAEREKNKQRELRKKNGGRIRAWTIGKSGM
jgi:hypothetical protein